MMRTHSTHRVEIIVRVPDHIFLSKVWADAAQDGGLAIKAESVIGLPVAKKLLIEFAESILAAAREDSQ